MARLSNTTPPHTESNDRARPWSAKRIETIVIPPDKRSLACQDISAIGEDDALRPQSTLQSLFAPPHPASAPYAHPHLGRSTPPSSIEAVPLTHRPPNPQWAVHRSRAGGRWPRDSYEQSLQHRRWHLVRSRVARQLWRKRDHAGSDARAHCHADAGCDRRAARRQRRHVRERGASCDAASPERRRPSSGSAGESAVRARAR